MQFNISKCKVLHIGHNNQQASYSMNGEDLVEIEEEKDLGVIIHCSLSPSRNVAECVKKANRVMGIIYRSFTYKGRDIMLSLYKSLIRPLIEYCVQAWSPYLVKDVINLEKVQRRFTKMIPEIRDLSYADRLKTLGLTTLATRRVRGDLIETFKLMKGLESIDYEELFTTSHMTNTKGTPTQTVQ
jgi:hypothetical protein